MNVRHSAPVAGLSVRLARDADDLRACRQLRHRCFFGTEGVDADAHDDVCDHLMVETRGVLRATARTLVVPDGTGLGRTLTAQSYDLTPLSGETRPVLEVGRFCIAPGPLDALVLRVAMGALAVQVDQRGVGLIIGCSSFAGADPARHAAALGVLAARHLGPPDLRPGARAAVTVPLADDMPDHRTALAGLPPLLRSYLGLGGWVSDHAVIDTAMDTVHVFTCVDVTRIPASRARALRRLAAQEF